MVSVKDIQYTYPKATTTMRFPDFDIQAGEHSLLLGESGGGKTTLLHLIGGLLQSQQGKIELDGVNVAALSAVQLDQFRGKKIGFIFQKNHLINTLTVKQNLLAASFFAGNPADPERAVEILGELGLADKLNSKVTELSVGQAQRVAIARAVMNKPALILADEPTSALDDKNCDKVISLLLKIANHSWSTLLVATHDQRLKERFNRQIELKSTQIPHP
jgi:ABC-type lipoprotein export system ATPase subunit